MSKHFDVKTGMISQEEVVLSIEQAYRSEIHWKKYFDQFNDLFTTTVIAQQKAKSKSVGLLCIQLYKCNNNCSIDLLYSILTTSIAPTELKFNSEVLDLSTKASFFSCLQNLDKNENV